MLIDMKIMPENPTCIASIDSEVTPKIRQNCNYYVVSQGSNGAQSYPQQGQPTCLFYTSVQAQDGQSLPVPAELLGCEGWHIPVMQGMQLLHPLHQARGGPPPEVPQEQVLGRQEEEV